MYGGIGMLNTPLNDAWILTINEDLSIHWKPYHLSYDHGKIHQGGRKVILDGGPYL